MVKVHIHGEMVECMLENTKMTEKMVQVSIYGKMAELTMENGTWENNTETDSISSQTKIQTN